MNYVIESVRNRPVARMDASICHAYHNQDHTVALAFDPPAIFCIQRRGWMNYIPLVAFPHRHPLIQTLRKAL